MKRSIIVLVILILSIPLYAAFEWNSETNPEAKLPGGSESVTVIWNAADLKIPQKIDYHFVGSIVSDNGMTATIAPTFSDGDFIGYGAFDFVWTIASTEKINLSIYITDPMVTSNSEELDWIMLFGTDGEDGTIGAETLNGSGYGESLAVPVGKHDPSSGTIKSSGKIAIEARTDSIISAPLESFLGDVYVMVRSGD